MGGSGWNYNFVGAAIIRRPWFNWPRWFICFGLGVFGALADGACADLCREERFTTGLSCRRHRRTKNAGLQKCILHSIGPKQDFKLDI